MTIDPIGSGLTAEQLDPSQLVAGGLARLQTADKVEALIRHRMPFETKDEIDGSTRTTAVTGEVAQHHLEHLRSTAQTYVLAGLLIAMLAGPEDDDSGE